MARWNQGVGGSLTNIISLLVAHHAEVNATNQFGQTALHWIARSDAPDATEQLLASKAAVDARDTDGRTPLFNAGKSLTPTVETVEEYKGRGFSRDEEETSQRIQALLVDRGGVLPKAVQSKPVATSGKLVVSVLGEVQKPGVVEFTPEKPLYLPEAIARAGGLNKVANARAIVINRHDKRIVFNLDEYLKNPGGNPAPALEDGDVIDIARTLY
jgi:hypothetical protein